MSQLPDNPFQSPKPTETPDTERMYQRWEAQYQSFVIQVYCFANGQLKMYVNEQLCYDACKWYKFTEIAAFNLEQHQFRLIAKSNLIRLKLSLEIDEQTISISMIKDFTDTGGSAEQSPTWLTRFRRIRNMAFYGALCFLAFRLIQRMFS